VACQEADAAVFHKRISWWNSLGKSGSQADSGPQSGFRKKLSEPESILKMLEACNPTMLTTYCQIPGVEELGSSKSWVILSIIEESSNLVKAAEGYGLKKVVVRVYKGDSRSRLMRTGRTPSVYSHLYRWIESFDSKLNNQVEEGVYSEHLGLNISFRLPDLPVFQVKMLRRHFSV